jgi:hypothetical protein
MLFKKLFLFLSILLLIDTVIYSQDFGTLRGLVTDSTTSEALAYGNVFIKEIGKGSSTDARGYFLIPQIPADKNFTLIVSYVGYRTKTIEIKLAKNKVIQYNIQLIPAGVELQTIEKIGERVVEKNETNISLQRIAMRDLEALPQGVETDVFRSLQYLPGVQSTGDVSARFYVRGGASNQNLVLIDGVTIYNPFHALGLFSVIDPDMINNIEFYKGGFSADLGGRLSSVIKIITKDGNKNRFSAKGSASLLSGKFLLEGPIPKGSFIFTGRKSYSTAILKKFLNDQNVPADFHDIFFKLNYANPDFLEGSKFTLNGFFSGDKITNNDPRIEDHQWSNKVFGFKWFQVGDSPLFYELGINYSKFSGEIIPKESTVRQSKNDIEDITLQMDFTYMFDSKDEIGLGFHFKNIKTDLYVKNALGVNTDISIAAANISLYAKYKFMQLDFFGMDVGFRLNLATLSENKQSTFFEPRASFTLRPFDIIAIKGAIGLYQQELITVDNEKDVINLYEPWIIAPNYLVPSKAIHYILGMEVTPTKNLTFNVEGYYKNMFNLPVLNENKIWFTDPDFVSGKGESYGVEFMTKLSNSWMGFTVSYTRSFAYRMLDDKRYYPRYDIRDMLNCSLELNFGKGWSASAMWTYNSGLPFTQVLGYYDKFYFDNIYTNMDQFDPTHSYPIYGIQNLGRLPVYHRLDLGVSKKIKIFDFEVEIDVSVINVYDRKNIFYFQKETGKRVNMMPFMPSATLKVAI